MTHNRTDGQGIIDLRQPREFGDVVDVNEMSRPGHPEGHDRNETLSAREHATVFRTEFGEHRGGFRDRPRNVTNERHGLHRQNFLREPAMSLMLAASLSECQCDTVRQKLFTSSVLLLTCPA